MDKPMMPKHKAEIKAIRDTEPSMVQSFVDSVAHFVLLWIIVIFLVIFAEIVYILYG
jgi:hypothetical protein